MPNGSQPEDPLITTWPRSDIVANQRAFLMDLDLPKKTGGAGALPAPKTAKRPGPESLRVPPPAKPVLAVTPASAPPRWKTTTPRGIPQPPAIPDTTKDAPTYAVYRYTRGINDLSNSGMGYGEPTVEQRCVPCCDDEGVLTTISVCMQRTRSGRQPLDAATTAIIKARPEPSDPNQPSHDDS